MLHERFDFTQNGGLPFTQDILKRMQDGYADISEAIALMIGGNAVLQGAEWTGDRWADGWLVYNGDLLPFFGAAPASSQISDHLAVVDEQASLLFDDGQSRNVILSRYLTNTSDVTTVPMDGTPSHRPFKKIIIHKEEQTVWRFSADNYDIVVEKISDSLARMTGWYSGSVSNPHPYLSYTLQLDELSFFLVKNAESLNASCWIYNTVDSDNAADKAIPACVFATETGGKNITFKTDGYSFAGQTDMAKFVFGIIIDINQ